MTTCGCASTVAVGALRPGLRVSEGICPGFIWLLVFNTCHFPVGLERSWLASHICFTGVCVCVCVGGWVGGSTRCNLGFGV